MTPTKTFAIEHRGCKLVGDVRGQGRPLVCIQGTGVHGDGWLPQVRDLANQYQCLTFDNRGMARSVPVGNPLSVELMAEDVTALMDALGWSSAHVVGHSLGGLIALQLALSHRQRVQSLALLCTFANGADATRLSLWMLWTGLRTRVGTRRQRRHAFLKLVTEPSAYERIDKDALAVSLAPLFGHDLADHPSIEMQQLAAMRRCNLTSRLGELDGLPVLVASARHDRIARPEYGRALAAGIPGASFVELANAAHGVPVLQPETINTLVRDHLNRATQQHSNL